MPEEILHPAERRPSAHQHQQLHHQQQQQQQQQLQQHQLLQQQLWGEGQCRHQTGPVLLLLCSFDKMNFKKAEATYNFG